MSGPRRTAWAAAAAALGLLALVGILALAWFAPLVGAAIEDARTPLVPARGAALALIGDMPYGAREETQFARVIEAINASHAAGGVSLVLHTGDVKRASERCDDALLQRRFALFQRFEPAFVVTPGDNDWTDCHRRPSGHHLPTERLARFRQIFYPQPGRSSGRRPIAVHTQASATATGTSAAHVAYVENQLWRFAGITLATVHVVGSDNDLEPWDGIDRHDSADTPRADRLAEFGAREAAALAWIDATFEHAREQGSAAVMITMHANPRFDRAPGSAARKGFDRVLERLASRTAAFGKPVLLAHGDSHIHRFDKPLLHPAPGERLPALTHFSRVENFGSPQVHWVEIRVDAGSPQVFQVVPRLVRANAWPF